MLLKKSYNFVGDQYKCFKDWNICSSGNQTPQKRGVMQTWAKLCLPFMFVCFSTSSPVTDCVSDCISVVKTRMETSNHSQEAASSCFSVYWQASLSCTIQWRGYYYRQFFFNEGSNANKFHHSCLFVWNIFLAIQTLAIRNKCRQPPEYWSMPQSLDATVSKLDWAVRGCDHRFAYRNVDILFSR